MNIIGLRLLSCPSHNELPLADVSANVSRARSVRHCWFGFLLPLFISDMSIVSCIIKHTHFSGRNVKLRSVSDRIDGGAPAANSFFPNDISIAPPTMTYSPPSCQLTFRYSYGARCCHGDRRDSKNPRRFG